MWWNIVSIIICILALVFNSIGWIYYRKNTDEETKEKEGWNSFYLVSTFLIIIVLLSRIEKI